MPNISQTALQAVLAEETEQVFLATLEISHPDFATTIRAVNNKTDIVRNGQTYIGFPFKMEPPNDTEDNIPRASITIGNVSREIIQELRKITSPASIKLEVVLASDPDTPEVGPFDFKLKNTSYDAFTINGELGYEEDFLNEPFPFMTFNPTTARGMFS